MKPNSRIKQIIDPEPYILPSDNDEMRKFVNKFKIDMMERAVANIRFAIENKMEVVEIFAFKNSPFVVTIAQKEYDSNLEHIEKFYTDREIFELVEPIQKLRKLLK